MRDATRAPSVQTWKYKTRTPLREWDGNRFVTKPLELRVHRVQIRLFPEQQLTTQGSQGRTFATMFAHLARPPGMSAAEFWFNVYVMLSRARCLDPRRVVLTDLPPRDFFEAGPPAKLIEALQKFEHLERDTRAFAKRVRQYLHKHHNWPEEGERWRPETPDVAVKKAARSAPRDARGARETTEAALPPWPVADDPSPTTDAFEIFAIR